MFSRQTNRSRRVKNPSQLQVESLEDRVSLSSISGTMPSSSALIRSDGVMDIAPPIGFILTTGSVKPPPNVMLLLD